MELEIIAHRGFSAIAPENTLAAFHAAVQHQANSVEFDVQLSADGMPIIIHDSTLDRTTNGTGLVREKTLKELKTLDAGSWFDSKFATEQIPTLQEALAILKDIPTYIYIEVKNSEYWSVSDISNFLNIIIESELQNKCIVISFDHNFLEQLRQQTTDIKVGYLVANLSAYQQIFPKAAADGKAVMMSEYHILLEHPFLISDSRNQAVDIVTWTVDDKQELEKLLNIDIVRIATNSLINVF